MDALAKGYLQRDAASILEQAIREAFELKDLPRAVELGIIRDYALYFNTIGNGAEAVDQILLAQLLLAEDDYLSPRLMTAVDDLSDEALEHLAEAQVGADDIARAEALLNSLKDRLNHSGERDGRSYAKWQDQVSSLIAVVLLMTK